MNIFLHEMRVYCVGPEEKLIVHGPTETIGITVKKEEFETMRYMLKKPFFIRKVEPYWINTTKCHLRVITRFKYKTDQRTMTSGITVAQQTKLDEYLKSLHDGIDHLLQFVS
jgi:hypothetical protein